MTMTFSADASGTFGTIAINGISQLEVHNDGSIKTPAGKIIASAQGIVGTVSQSLGLPTGAIIERGDNANGEYVKFADGTLICTSFVTSSSTAETTWTFPAQFSELKIRTSILPSTANVALHAGRVASSSLTGITYSIFLSSNARVVVGGYVISIGRWF